MDSATGIDDSKTPVAGITGEAFPVRVGRVPVPEILIHEGLVRQEQLDRAKRGVLPGEPLGGALVRLGMLGQGDYMEVLSRFYNLPVFDLSEVEIDDEIIALIPQNLAEKYTMIPLRKEDKGLGSKHLVLAIAELNNPDVIQDIRFRTGLEPDFVLAPESQIKTALEKYYGKGVSSTTDLTKVFDGDGGEVEVLPDVTTDVEKDLLMQQVEDAPVVAFVRNLLADAVKQGASDIHLEPYEKTFRVRYRIDGVLYDKAHPPLSRKDGIISRIKIMANLDISEHRVPQDGRIKMRFGKSKEVDFRVSVLPTLFGESVVMRILDKSALHLDLSALGFEDRELKLFLNAVHQPWGMVLVTGPTGSGKSTTLYSALTGLNEVTDKILTVEDPVEIPIPGVNQVQIDEAVGRTFAATLRSFMRQDPDIIMVGEIRDFETAETTVKAALTGHLVLSTLHTNDAPSTINRLLNMGVEPFLVTSSLLLICAQRLVRRICKKCKEKVDVSPSTLLEIGFSEEESKTVQVFHGRGCDACNNTGYKGRTSCYEVLPITDEFKEAILQGFSSVELKREAIRQGMRTLRQAGLLKVKAGVTTIEEVLKATRPD